MDASKVAPFEFRPVADGLVSAMKHDPRDRVEREVDATPSQKPAGPLQWLEGMWLLALRDPDQREVFARAIRDFTVESRRDGNAVERIIVAIKEGLGSMPCDDRRAAAELVEFAVTTCIDEYYHPTTSEFPRT